MFVKSALSSDYKGPLKKAALRMDTLRLERDAAAAGPPKPAPLPRSPTTISGTPSTNAVSRKFKKYTHSGTFVRARLAGSRCGFVGRAY